MSHCFAGFVAPLHQQAVGARSDPISALAPVGWSHGRIEAAAADWSSQELSMRACLCPIPSRKNRS